MSGRLALPLLLAGVAFCAMPSHAALQLYVAPNGNDAWSGKRDTPSSVKPDGPFATLERARDVIRSLRRAGTMPKGGVTVWIRGGEFFRDRSFMISAADGGTADAPVAYRAVAGETPRLIGGREIRGWHLVDQSPAKDRIAVRSLGRVWQADLKAQGIPVVPIGAEKTSSLPARVMGTELYFQDRPMPIATWPAAGWERIATVPRGQKGDRFTYKGNEPAFWKDPANLWVHGYWTWDWAESYVKVGSIDPSTKAIVTLPPYGVYGYSPNRRWRAVNVLEELGEPGQWAIDRSAGVVYFRPPAPLEDGRAFAACLEDPIIRVDGASYVTIEGLTVECGLGAGIQVTGGSDVTVRGCTLRNLGTYGVWIGNGLETGMWFDYANVIHPRDGGEHHTVADCDFYNLGGGGIVLAGGDRVSLTPSQHTAVNNHIHDYARWNRTCRAGISIDGVGARVANNLIHDAPHQAIFVNGNDNLVELNEIHHVCMETSDAGAFYMGRDWAQRGNVVRYNYFHDIGATADVNAVYLDDWISGTVVFGNVFRKSGRGVMVGGGRDNLVENNIFVDCTPAVHVDSRGQGWARYYFDGTDNTLFERLKLVHPDRPPYSTHYPPLAKILADEPAVAKGNRVLHNISSGGRWLDLRDGLTDRVVEIRDNLTEGDPGFVDAAGGNLTLRPDSPAWKLGFQRIPMEMIGLRRSH